MNLRKYGSKPYRAAVVHGGPGAAGEMAPVARELSNISGILEPLQTETTINGQVKELVAVLRENGEIPFVLIGYSWGAWLSYIVAGKYPSLVDKVILISGGPFEERYASDIMSTRLSRLSVEEKNQALLLTNQLKKPLAKNKDRLFARWGELLSRGDSFDPIPHENEIVELRQDINETIWQEAQEMRTSGELLELGHDIKCPVVAIHGDYDPHPAAGVREPLSKIIKDFRFILLGNCGHTPWFEREAREQFFNILREEISRRS